MLVVNIESNDAGKPYLRSAVRGQPGGTSPQDFQPRALGNLVVKLVLPDFDHHVARHEQN